MTGVATGFRVKTATDKLFSLVLMLVPCSSFDQSDVGDSTVAFRHVSSRSRVKRCTGLGLLTVLLLCVRAHGVTAHT